MHLWQKYNIIDSDLIDKLNKISASAKLDLAINANESTQSKENETLNVSSNDNKEQEAEKSTENTNLIKNLNHLQNKLKKQRKLLAKL